MFLQVLDSGRLTDGKGIVVNFKNCVIIMTSNLGATYLTDLPDDGSLHSKPVPQAVQDLVFGAVRSHFSPEFLNRIDNIVLFNKLSRAQVRGIVDLRIEEVQKRLKSKNMKLNVDLDALDYLGVR